MDVDVAFSLSAADISEVQEQFKGVRLGEALQLVFIRATGRWLDKVTGIPANPANDMQVPGLSEISIARRSRRCASGRPNVRRPPFASVVGLRGCSGWYQVKSIGDNRRIVDPSAGFTPARLFAFIR